MRLLVAIPIVYYVRSLKWKQKPRPFVVFQLYLNVFKYIYVRVYILFYMWLINNWFLTHQMDYIWFKYRKKRRIVLFLPIHISFQWNMSLFFCFQSLPALDNIIFMKSEEERWAFSFSVCNIMHGLFEIIMMRQGQTFCGKSKFSVVAKSRLMNGNLFQVQHILLFNDYFIYNGKKSELMYFDGNWIFWTTKFLFNC